MSTIQHQPMYVTKLCSVITYWCSFIYWFNDKLFVVKWYVSNFTPWKTNFWR